MSLRSLDAVPRLGAHMSIVGGMPAAVSRAVEVGATALQVFVKNASQWAARPLSPGEAASFRSACREAGLTEHTMAHASYLVNLGSPDEDLWLRSIAALRQERERCAELGIPLLVVHPGAHMGAGEERGLARVADALDRVVGAESGGVRILLEITAGQGTSLGATFEHLAWVLDHASCTDDLGVCFDTCHAFAAGYEFRDQASYRDLLRLLDGTVGIDRIRAFHLNDSRAGFGARVDRHAAIGEGEVGLEAFRLILNDPTFAGTPMVLETPKGEDLAEDRINLAVLRSLVAR